MASTKFTCGQLPRGRGWRTLGEFLGGWKAGSALGVPSVWVAAARGTRLRYWMRWGVRVAMTRSRSSQESRASRWHRCCVLVVKPHTLSELDAYYARHSKVIVRKTHRSTPRNRTENAGGPSARRVGWVSGYCLSFAVRIAGLSPLRGRPLSRGC